MAKAATKEKSKPTKGKTDTKDTIVKEKKQGRGRKVFITVKGKEVARVDYIRKRFFEDGKTRSEIAKELTEIQGKTVAYQIVFQATKKKDDEEDGDSDDE